MKRDQDLLWGILAVLEASEKGDENDDSIAAALGKTHPDVSFEAIRHHLLLLDDRGLAVQHGAGNWRITDIGHNAVASNPAHVTHMHTRLNQ
ncbi:MULTISPECIES: winged-helix domain-containing protein [Paraburkholderia]|uniref:Ribonuclease R winged-helix domain-containing protein n=1 Tax=Paraburkholderia sartisoli TaxID=83784 RepID=A0A1H4CVB2_9BURK|nr:MULTISPECIES: winged-helix domain-containing protein [Paraburkholderia]SEA64350.1 Ribonuclease R winged-helix domain-containing protein [Paraburkholderia sartisoli]